MTEQEYKYITELNERLLNLSSMLYNLEDGKPPVGDTSSIHNEIMNTIPIFDEYKNKIASLDAIKCMFDIELTLSNLLDYLST